MLSQAPRQRVGGECRRRLMSMLSCAMDSSAARARRWPPPPRGQVPCALNLKTSSESKTTSKCRIPGPHADSAAADSDTAADSTATADSAATAGYAAVLVVVAIGVWGTVPHSTIAALTARGLSVAAANTALCAVCCAGLHCTQQHAYQPATALAPGSLVLRRLTRVIRLPRSSRQEPRRHQRAPAGFELLSLLTRDWPR